MSSSTPTLVLTQGDPAGIGPEIILKLLAQPHSDKGWRPLVVAEQAAIEAVSAENLGTVVSRIEFLDPPISSRVLAGLDSDSIAVVDPVQTERVVTPGESGPSDAAGAIAAIDLAIELVQTGVADAMVTAPISKHSIARHHLPDFRGHTDYLANKAGLSEYGKEYLMAFLAPDLQVALLTTHLSTSEALQVIDCERIELALRLLESEAGGRIAVAAIDPHAGEEGLIGSADAEVVAPAVARARGGGLDVHGPESADSLFARARKGEFDWVLALYHDQGLIAVKTAWFGWATNWTMGLPFLRTSVDHGTAFELAGHDLADSGPLAVVVDTTLELIAGQRPYRARPDLSPPSQPDESRQ